MGLFAPLIQFFLKGAAYFKNSFGRISSVAPWFRMAFRFAIHFYLIWQMQNKHTARADFPGVIFIPDLCREIYLEGCVGTHVSFYLDLYL